MAILSIPLKDDSLIEYLHPRTARFKPV